MSKLKICFVGIGSIAKRHIRNLHIVCDRRGIDLQIDAYRRSGTAEIPEGVCTVYDAMETLPDDYDAVFITNPTALHMETLEQFHNVGRNFFIEKPAVSEQFIERAKHFPRKKDAVYTVAAPLRYNAVIQYIKQNIDPSEVISVRSISSSYLPDWRPGQDYRKTYSAQRTLGGGVAIDLIHEWDYLTYLFGWPEEVHFLSGKKSPLEIDSDDYAIYIAEFETMIGELHLDYFGRKTIREIQLFTKEDTVIGDIQNNTIHFLRQGRFIDFKEERDDYQRREIDHFLNMILGVAEVEDGFAHGVRVIELTQGKI